MTAAPRHDPSCDKARMPSSWSNLQVTGEKRLYPADFAGIDDLAEVCWVAVKDNLIQRGYGPREAKIHLALHEALVNAWKHGNHKRLDLPITFRWRFAKEVTFEVLDAGQGFACHTQTDPFTPDRLAAEDGRGLSIIMICADSVSWKSNGCHITITFTPHERTEKNSHRV